MQEAVNEKSIVLYWSVVALYLSTIGLKISFYVFSLISTQSIPSSHPINKLKVVLIYAGQWPFYISHNLFGNQIIPIVFTIIILHQKALNLCNFFVHSQPYLRQQVREVAPAQDVTIPKTGASCPTSAQQHYLTFLGAGKHTQCAQVSLKSPKVM